MSEFRKDIQSLRGLSLLLVFFYHYNKKICPSGFIGVDIFFLISGYVNTISFITKNNKSIGSFYYNRLKRLFPVCHLVLYISIAAIRKMNLLYQNKQLYDVIYSLFSFSNYRFIFLSVDYLSQSEASSIVLHFWSLSLEEQFYLFFPFYISILQSRTTILIIITFISFMYSNLINFKYHYISYFSILSRIWQFTFGIIVTYDNYIFSDIYNSDILLMIILFFCSLVTYEIYFPSPLSSIPLLLIYIVISNRNNSFILKSKLLLTLGNISYCFYLYHYIIIYYFRKIVKKKHSLIINMIFTSVLSYITNICFENPIRYTERKFIIILVYIISIISLLMICILLSHNNIRYMKEKYKYNNHKIVTNNCKKYCHIKSNSMIYSPNDIKKAYTDFYSAKNICPIHSKKDLPNIIRNPIILLLTDSHGDQWFNTIIPYAKNMNYVVIHIYFWQKTIYSKKFENIYKIFKIMPKINYIISTHYLIEQSNTTIFKLNYLFYMEILLKHCNEVYVIHDTPHFRFNPNLCLLSSSNYEQCYSLIGMNATFYRFPIYSSKRVHYIDMIPYICLNSYKCYFIWNSIPIYLDTNHLTFQFTKTLSKQILNHIHFEKQNQTIDYKDIFFYKCSYERI